MRRTDLIILMDEAKANNGGASSFLVIISESEGRSADSILRHFEAEGIISGWNRDGGNINIDGYEG